jgi:hypothetical protein
MKTRFPNTIRKTNINRDGLAMSSAVKRLSIILVVGTALSAMPALDMTAFKFGHDIALAAKGGNGGGNKGGGNAGGNGNGNGNAGGGSSNAGGKSGNAGAGSASNSSKGAGAQASTKGKSATSPGALKKAGVSTVSRNLLGRWNAAKPIDHPAIQAHIKNANFTGTIGMIAAYALAQTNYNAMEADIAAAQEVLANKDLAVAAQQALTAAGYVTLADYQTAVVAGAPTIAEVETALQTFGDGTIDGPSTDVVAAASETIAAGVAALADLADAEANMEAYSNRGTWSDIRADVRTRMGLDPLEDDLAVPNATATTATQ